MFLLYLLGSLISVAIFNSYRRIALKNPPARYQVSYSGRINGGSFFERIVYSTASVDDINRILFVSGLFALWPIYGIYFLISFIVNKIVEKIYVRNNKTGE